MANQPIAGYRELSAAEVALINQVKAKAEEVGALVDQVMATPGIDARWASTAKTDLQKGFMELTRSVAQPTTF